MVCWERFLLRWPSVGPGITATICLLLPLFSFSNPTIRKINRFHCDVTVGNVDGTLTWGTFGYCLDVSNNITCLHSDLLYVINNAQVLAQVKMVSTKNLSILNLVALLGALLGAVGTSYFTFLSFQRSTACFAGLGVVFGLIGLAIDIVFKTTDGSVCHFGPGSYLNFSAFGILACLLLYAVACWKEDPSVEKWSSNGRAAEPPVRENVTHLNLLSSHSLMLENTEVSPPGSSSTGRYPGWQGRAGSDLTISNRWQPGNPVPGNASVQYAGTQIGPTPRKKGKELTLMPPMPEEEMPEEEMPIPPGGWRFWSS